MKTIFPTAADATHVNDRVEAQQMQRLRRATCFLFPRRANGIERKGGKKPFYTRETSKIKESIAAIFLRLLTRVTRVFRRLQWKILRGGYDNCFSTGLRLIGRPAAAIYELMLTPDKQSIRDGISVKRAIFIYVYVSRKVWHWGTENEDMEVSKLLTVNYSGIREIEACLEKLYVTYLE